MSPFSPFASDVGTPEEGAFSLHSSRPPSVFGSKLNDSIASFHTARMLPQKEVGHHNSVKKSQRPCLRISTVGMSSFDAPLVRSQVDIENIRKPSRTITQERFTQQIVAQSIHHLEPFISNVNCHTTAGAHHSTYTRDIHNKSYSFNLDDCSGLSEDEDNCASNGYMQGAARRAPRDKPLDGAHIAQRMMPVLELI